MVEDFSTDIEHFIATNIKSVAELEAVLLLRDTAERYWTAADVGQALYSSPEVTASQLAELSKRGLLALSHNGEVDVYRYLPARPEIDQHMTTLAKLYKQRPVSVITAIYAEPTDTVRTFADAFRLRKDK